MRFIAGALLLVCMWMPSTADACSMTRSMTMFVADQDGFEREHDFPISLDVPTPVVVVKSVVRAKSVAPGSCDAYAHADIEVSLPEGTLFSLADVGLVFRSPQDRPQSRFIAFPNFPVQSMRVSEDGRTAYFHFMLVDSPERSKESFELDVEVFAINRYLQVGPSAVISLVAP